MDAAVGVWVIAMIFLLEQPSGCMCFGASIRVTVEAVLLELSWDGEQLHVDNFEPDVLGES